MNPTCGLLWERLDTATPHHTSTPAPHKLLILHNPSENATVYLSDCDYKVSVLILFQNYYSRNDWTQNTLGHILKSYKVANGSQLSTFLTRLIRKLNEWKFTHINSMTAVQY